MFLLKKTNDITSLYVTAERNANAFNLKCLAVLCFLAVVTEVLNEIGIFNVPLYIMRPVSLFSFALLVTPILIYIISDRILKKKDSVLQRPSFKFIIIIFSFLGMALLNVTLSFHAVVLLPVLPLIAAQYRENKIVFICTIIATVLMVPIGVYGAFFFGAMDRNLMKGLIADAESATFENRLAIATPERMMDLFIHYVIPRIFGVVSVVMLTSGIIKRNGRMLEEQAVLSDELQDDIERINQMQSHVIDSLANLIETRDEGTGEHVARTKEYVKMLACEMKKDEKYKDILTDEYIEMIYGAAPLHDIGKIAVSDNILLKPGKLTDEEFNEMKKHTLKGGNMVSTTFAALNDIKFLKVAEEIAVSHHEKWDGTGYPQGLSGENIPLSARIMAVADVFDALTSVRVYKRAIAPEKALDIMMAESGAHFDPSIMKVVESIRDKLISVAISPIKNIR